ncbi:hypothetical protein [Streptomyces sp. 4F14]|uniref:hypothetical protein n=1 Tax=Streptomyces sp. 4F14 TaxID=3394380 RepID=UPI003A86080D
MDVGRFAIRRFELGTLCLTESPGADACMLFTGHSPGHSWEVTDPVMVELEALPPALRMRVLKLKGEG